MKWVYIPIMFALAFFYTKMSFNDLSYHTSAEVIETITSGRKPASISVKERKDSPRVIKKVPAKILYQHLIDPALMAPFRKVMEFQGTVVGDLHAESFGFVVDDKHRAMFAVSEFRDVSEGLLLYDVIAHLVSAKTLDKKVSWMNYFEAYKNGLEDKKHTFSYYVEQGIEEAAANNQKRFDDQVMDVIPFTFKQIPDNALLVDNARKAIIQTNLKVKYPQIEFYDLYELPGAFKSYQMLVRLRPQDKIEWLELSENDYSDYDQAFSKGAELDFAKRFVLLKLNVFDGRLNQALNFLVIESKFFVMKFGDHFGTKLNLAEIPADDYYDLMMDEAYTLGKMHRRSLGGDNVRDYLKAWAAIPAATIDEKTVELKYKFRDLNQ